MAFRKIGPFAAVTASATTTITTSASLGAPYGRVLGFSAKNWASSAKAGAGTDALIEVKIQDADGRIVFLDAADRDYKTAQVNIFFGQDETATGLSDLHLDATGAALSSQAGMKGAICKSPLTLIVLDAGTATDYFEMYLWIEI